MKNKILTYFILIVAFLLSFTLSAGENKANGSDTTSNQTVLLPDIIPGAGGVTVSASYNRVVVTNNNQHAISFTWTQASGKKKSVQTINPGGSYSIPRPGKRWSRSEVKNSTLTTIYDKKAHNRDRKTLTTNYQRLQLQIESSQRVQISRLDQEYLARGAFMAASYVESDSDDGPLIGGLKWLIRSAGKLGNFFYSVVDAARYWEANKYKTWDQLLADQAEDYLKDKALEVATKKFADLVDYRGNLDMANGATKMLFSYATAYHKILVQAEARKDTAERTFNNSMKQIDRMLENSRTSEYDLSTVEYKSKPFNFQMEIAAMPLNYGDPLNDNWKANPERFYRESDSGNDEDLGDIEDAFWNGNIAASARFTATRSFRLFSRRDRIYLGGSYSNNYYDFQRYDGYSVPTELFQTTQPGGFSIKFPIVYELQQLSYDLSYRIGIGGIGNLTLTGGYLHQKGRLNFDYAELDEGWAWRDQKTEPTETERQPYYGAAFQLRRRNAQSRLHLYTAFRSYRTDLQLDPANQFTYTAGSRIDQKSTVSSGGQWIYRIQGGVVLTL